jgi:hypothetical protein
VLTPSRKIGNRRIPVIKVDGVTICFLLCRNADDRKEEDKKEE